MSRGLNFCSCPVQLTLSVWFLKVFTYIHTNLYSAKNRENESEVLAQDDYTV